MPRRMNESELLAAVEKEEANCIVHFVSLLSEQRRKAMQYYYGQPYGNEVEGKSAVVTSEVRDAVEGILPSLIEIFTASDDIVRFEPEDPKDEESAQQATDYLNYLFTRKNNGFLALYCMFKDALLQKNGYVKVYWEDSEQRATETYEDLDDAEFDSLIDDTGLELKEHTEKPDTEKQNQISQAIEQLKQQLVQGEQQIRQMPPQAMQQAGQQLQGMRQQLLQLQKLPAPKLHDAVFLRSKKSGGIQIDPLPPEEVLISRETTNRLPSARFVEHRTLKTLSDIREMGFDVPDDIADYAPNADYNVERVERLKYDDALAYRQDSDTSDPSTKRVWLCEAYVRVDFDGDGIAELRKVTKVGKTVLDNIEFDSLPIIGGTAVLMPHKHYGLSLFDLVNDIQLIKSTITRQLLDNAYVANNGRVVALEGMVNMSDLLTSRPNGIIRTKAMGAVTRLDNPVLGAPFYNLLEYFDKVIENRVGSTGFPNAVDPDAINAKAAFVDSFKKAAMERIMLMARLLGETCVKDIFWKMLELVSKHQSKPQIVKLRGKWIEIDPRDWHNKFHMTVTVGIGTGSQQTTLSGAMGILQIQQGALQAGLGGKVVSAENVYKAANKYAKAVFPKDEGLYFTDPSTLPPQPEQPNPELLKIQAGKEKAEMQAQLKQAQMEQNERMEQQRMRFEGALTQQAQHFEGALAQMKHGTDLQKTAIDAASDQKTSMIDAVTALKVAERQATATHADTVLGGVIEHLSQMNQQAHERHQQVLDHLVEYAKIASAEKELVKDPKTGKTTGVRTKKAA